MARRPAFPTRLAFPFSLPLTIIIPFLIPLQISIPLQILISLLILFISHPTSITTTLAYSRYGRARHEPPLPADARKGLHLYNHDGSPYREDYVLWHLDGLECDGLEYSKTYSLASRWRGMRWA
jgi:hypothetical protein